jgi:steroid delta-isomerase-like uncharacterized protein
MTDTISNQDVIKHLYEEALNKRNMKLLNDLISENFVGVRGLRGPAGFEEPVKMLMKAFPDIQWNVQEVISSGNKVVVRWVWTGTHKAAFQHYTVTNKNFSNDGIGIYELNDGRIVSAQIQTDRLGFLQQMEAVPLDLTLLSNKKSSAGQVSFVDKFFVPRNSADEFIKQMEYNRDFIKQQPGLVKSERYDREDDNGNLTILTVAVWQDQDHLEQAKEAIQAEFRRTAFNPQEFYKRLNIKLERETYVPAED